MPTRHLRGRLSFTVAALASLLGVLLLPTHGAEPDAINAAPHKPIDFLEQTLGLTPVDTDAPPAEATYIRTFRVEPGSLLDLTSVPGASLTQPQEALQTFLAAQGYYPAANPSESSRAKLFYNDRTGLLTVRGTLRDLDQIETALATLSITPPQVMIEMRLAEFNSDAINEELADLLGLNSLARFSTADKLPTLSIQTETKTRLLIRALEQKVGVDLLSAPRTITLSGRQVRITLEEPETIITDPPFTAPGKPAKAKWSPKLEPSDSGN